MTDFPHPDEEDELQQRGIIARDPEPGRPPEDVPELAPDEMAGEVFSASIPPEPPEYSIVVGKGMSGTVWQRSDGIKSNERSRRWYPALYREHGILEPMCWKHMIAEVGQVTILRWGSGEQGEKNAAGIRP